MLGELPLPPNARFISINKEKRLKKISNAIKYIAVNSGESQLSNLLAHLYKV